MLPAKGYSGTMVRRNLHLMCVTSLSSCWERYILLCAYFSTGKLSAQTAEASVIGNGQKFIVASPSENLR